MLSSSGGAAYRRRQSNKRRPDENHRRFVAQARQRHSHLLDRHRWSFGVPGGGLTGHRRGRHQGRRDGDASGEYKLNYIPTHGPNLGPQPRRSRAKPGASRLGALANVAQRVTRKHFYKPCAMDEARILEKMRMNPNDEGARRKMVAQYWSSFVPTRPVEVRVLNTV